MAKKKQSKKRWLDNVKEVKLLQQNLKNPFMRLKQNRLLLTLLVIILVISSCKKNDTIVNPNQLSEKQIIEQFTTVPKGSNPILQRIADKLKQKENQTPFLSTLGQRAGLPIWTACDIKKRATNSVAKGVDNSYNIVFVPLAIPNTQNVDGFLACKVSTTSVEIIPFEDKDYALYGFGKPNGQVDAEEVVTQSIILEYKAFGHTKYRTGDSRLFNPPNHNGIPNEYGEVAISDDPITSDYSISVCHHHCTGCTGECDQCNICVSCETFFFTCINWDDWSHSPVHPVQ